jgi:hypothetical protein
VKEPACLFAGIHVDFINGLTLHNTQVVWGKRLENYYGAALACEHVHGLQLNHFTDTGTPWQGTG